MQSIPIVIYRKWIKNDSASLLTQQIFNNTNWDQPKAKVYGKSYLVPRLTSFLAIKGVAYSYSGVVHKGEGWPSWFVPLLREVQDYCDVDFNGCLLNLYRNGEDCMGWHADNEKVLDSSKPIASISLGAQRDFLLKNLMSLEKYSFSLNNGDLLLMKTDCQRHWIHSLPKRKKVKELRINLTFRKYL